MELVKFVKVTEENKDAQARKYGWEDEAALLKDAEFDTMVGLWTDVDDVVEIDSITGVRVERVEAVCIENRNMGDRWSTTVYARAIDLMIVEPGVGCMSWDRFEDAFC